MPIRETQRDKRQNERERDRQRKTYITDRISRECDLQDPQRNVQCATCFFEQAERQAVNTTVQGSAADIVKAAMTAIDQQLMKVFPHTHFPHSHRRAGLLLSSSGTLCQWCVFACVVVHALLRCFAVCVSMCGLVLICVDMSVDMFGFVCVCLCACVCILCVCMCVCVRVCVCVCVCVSLCVCV